MPCTQPPTKLLNILIFCGIADGRVNTPSARIVLYEKYLKLLYKVLKIWREFCPNFVRSDCGVTQPKQRRAKTNRKVAEVQNRHGQ